MQHVMNKKEIVNGIRNLDVIERLDIITDIWDEIKESRALEAVSDSDKKLLLSRLANYRANPESATDWEELRQEIHDRAEKKQRFSIKQILEMTSSSESSRSDMATE